MGRNRKEVFIMRKMITMAVTAALAISTLTACGKTDKKETTASTAATTASTASTAATTASTEAKTEAKAEAKDTSAAAAESKADAQTPVSGSVATDGSTSMERQQYMLNMVLEIIRSDFDFDSFEEVNPYFKGIINGFKQMNYSEFQSDKFKKFESEVRDMISERRKD